MSRSSNAVSQMLRARGIPTRYRYTQTGYVQPNGAGFTGPGLMITRQRSGRYGGMEDLGEVRVYLIVDEHGIRSDQAFADRVEAALVDAGLPHLRRGDMFAVPDEGA